MDNNVVVGEGEVIRTMKIGDKLRGRVTSIQPYGAFIELETGTSGLVHISEIRTGYIDNIYDSLTVGEEITVQIVDYDEFTKKISLSIRTLEETRVHFSKHRRFSSSKRKYGFSPLRKQLSIWITESLEFLKKESQKASKS